MCNNLFLKKKRQRCYTLNEEGIAYHQKKLFSVQIHLEKRELARKMLETTCVQANIILEYVLLRADKLSRREISDIPRQSIVAY